MLIIATITYYRSFASLKMTKKEKQKDGKEKAHRVMGFVDSP